MMNAAPEGLQNLFDRTFAGISQVRKAEPKPDAKAEVKEKPLSDTKQHERYA